MGVPILGNSDNGNKPAESLPPEPRIRVLYCHQCQTLDEMPDYKGPSKYDEALQAVIDQRHTEESGLKHVGQLFDVPVAAWKDRTLRKNIIKQFKQGGSKGLAEVDPEFYNSRMIFEEDALKCFKEHLRPQTGCPDYRSKNKLLTPDTKAERKDAGLSARPTGHRIAICDFCPVSSYYAKKEQGL